MSIKFKSKVFVALGGAIGYRVWYVEKRIKDSLPKNPLLVSGEQKKKAIVIGAGVAGVSTAYMLGNRGYNVLVLEASNSPASECSACPAGSITETVSMFDRNSWIDVLRSWNPVSSTEQNFFHIKWFSTLTDPHFWRWILIFSYYSIVQPKSQNINRAEMQEFTYFAIDRLNAIIDEHSLQAKCGLNKNGLLYTSHGEVEKSSNEDHNEITSNDHKITSNDDESCQRLERDEICRIESCISNWKEKPKSADLYKGSNWLTANSENFTHHLAAISENVLGVKFNFDTKVEAFDVTYKKEENRQNKVGKIEKIYTNRGFFDIDDETEVIIAAGSWTPRILWNLSYFVPIYPMKGYSVAFDLPEEQSGAHNNLSLDKTDLPTRMIIDKNLYVSRLGNQVRVTSIGEFAGWETKPDEKINKTFREQGQKHVPGLLSLFNSTPTRCGLRPQSADGVIILGRVEGVKNLSLNVGPGQTGWKLSVGAASVLAAILDNDVEKYSFDHCKFSPSDKVVRAPFWSMVSRLRWS